MMSKPVSTSRPAAIFILQNQRHAQLENFLNGYTLDHVSKMFFPLRDKHRIDGKHLDARTAATHLSERFAYPGRVPARFVAVRVQPWKNWLRKTKPKSLTEFMVQVRAEFKAIEGHLVGAYVHGSLSDLQLTPYSDADLLVVLREKTIRDPDALLVVRNALYRVNRLVRKWDPLQHHGVFVLAEQDLSSYCPAWLPLEAIRKATVLVGSDRLAFCVRDGRAEARILVKEHVAYLRRLLEKPAGAYHFKEMCSIVMLLPALVMGARGRFVYKPESFGPARRLFKKESWTAIEKASEIRRSWTKKSGFASLTAHWPTFWASTVGARLEPAQRNVEFENSVRVLLEDPVLKS